jgi:BMFP domain-containing protein YqiC
VTRRIGWTLWTLATHMQRQLDDLAARLSESQAAADRSVTAALSAAEKAVAKAEMAAEKRFESVNEFRGTLSDQAATFPTRAEVGAQNEALSARISALEATSQRSTGHDTGATEARTGLRLDSGWLLVLIGTIAAIIIGFTR